MPNTAARQYRDDNGVLHKVVVRKTDRAWQVLDIDEHATDKLVESLVSPEDGEPQAQAIARLYLQDKQTAAAAIAA